MPSSSKLSRRRKGHILITAGSLLIFAVSLVLAGNASEFSAVAINPGADTAAQSAHKIQQVERRRLAYKAQSLLAPLTRSVLSEVATDISGNEETNNGVSLETLHHISFATPVIQIAGFDFDPENHPAAGWGETSSNGGVNNFRWATRPGGWVVQTMDQPGGGIRAAQADFVLRQDGKPFFAYAIRDAWIFGQDWYTAHIVDLDLFPTGHGSSVQPLESGSSCISSYPKFAMAFVPTAPGEPLAASPTLLLGTHCPYGGWLSLDNATVHGSPAFRETAGTAGEFHSIDYARGPLGSHHVTYYSERGGPNWGAYYSNGSPGHELLLVKPHRNRAAETSVAVGADGRIHVAIGGVPLCNNTFEGGLLYLTSTDGVNWTRMFVDDVSGRSPSITLDAAGNPHIAYWRHNSEVRLASLEAHAWTTTAIYTATAPVVRASVKLAFDAADQPHVLFFNPDTSDIQMSSGLPSNRPPMVTNPGSKASEVGQSISFQIVTSDSESDTLSFTACNLPPGLSINPATGLITGTITDPPADHQVAITVGDVANNSTSITFNWLTIPPGSAYQLAFTVQPSSTNTPNAISPSVKVMVQDLFGNTLNDAVDSVTIALANNPGGSTLSGGLTRTAVNGVATFDDLRLDQAGTGYTLRATSGSLISATSNGFDIFHPAVIEVTEQILVTDAPSLLSAAVINVSENIAVLDAPALLPAAVINVSENIAVQDAPALLPAAMLNVIEQINVLDTPAFWPPVATPTGANVSVQVENVKITFHNVSTAGFTSIVPIDPESAGTLPAGFTLCSGCPAYEITTTAVYTPPITVALTVPGVTDQVFGQLKMLHGENGVLIDRTTARNFISREIFGSVNSLSPFVIVQDASIPSSTPTPTPTPTVNAGQVIISEFRLRGPGNNGVAAVNDEFVEIYNATDSDIIVSTTDGSAGWALAASDGVARFVIPNGTVIPARGHFLGVNSAGYSLSASAAADIQYTTDVPDNAGIALFRTANPANFTLNDRLDAVGPTEELNELYREGVGYPAFTSADLALNLEHSFYRSLCSFQQGVGCATPGNPRDTDKNAVDFLFVDTNGALTAAGQRLGAPGPENLASPIRRDNTMPLVLLDASVAAAAPPNRLRNATGDPANASTFGTLAVRRRITNNTGSPVTRLQFRIVELTTSPAPNGIADLRARTTSGSLTISGINDANTCAATGTPNTTPCMVTVQPTTLMQLPNQSGTVGGGQNAVLAIGTITMSEPLQDGQSINVQFLLGVQQTGLFRFLITIEALP